MTEFLAGMCVFAVLVGCPLCFMAGLWWAGRPKDVYPEDGGWRHEEAPAFYRTKESEE